MANPLNVSICVHEACSANDWQDARELVSTYLDALGLSPCTGDSAAELSELDQRYGPPGGALMLARVEGEAVGCCALKPLPDVDHSNACEMKRLFVRPEARKLGLGRLLVEAVVESARVAGYSCILLDTLNEMEAARALYEEVGFFEIPPYQQSPIPGAHHLKLLI